MISKPAKSLLGVRLWFPMVFLLSCTSKEKSTPIIYDGPLRQAVNITMHYAEKEKLKVILQAKKFNEFQNGG